MTDYLKPLSMKNVAAWHYRLVDLIAKEKINGVEPLASMFLRHWLDNRVSNSIFKFKAPLYLRQHKSVKSVQLYHKDVFLTKKKANIGKFKKWVGLIPRLQGTNGYTKWKGGDVISMKYESLCDIAPDLIDIIKIQSSGSESDKDLMTSLRGFQLESDIKLNMEKVDNSMLKLTFKIWKCRVKDTYDWNYDEYLTVPNPDYRSKKTGAVRPDDRFFKVYHVNAKRLEDANLAAPYIVESDRWNVNYPALLKSVIVDSQKKLK